MSTAPAHRTPQLAGILWKTVSDECNLACDYCYYGGRRPRAGARQRIAAELLDKVAREYLALAGSAATFVWQGGEPLLAGLDFFEAVVALEARHAAPGTRIGNAVQTNGTLLSGEWARFFRRYNFLVGVSVDGPREIHDAHRASASGTGSFEQVMRRIAHLREHGVAFNVLTVVHPGNVQRARELMTFYERQGFDHVQFIPAMGFDARAPAEPARYLVTADDYGDFLCEAFDLWWNGGAPRLSVRLFDNALAVYCGGEPEACHQRRRCPRFLVLEHDGSAYPCDFYLAPEWRLGNLATDSLEAVLAHPTYERFLRLKEALPGPCTACSYRALCGGGCPRNWARAGAGRAPGPDHLCAAYRRFFAHADSRLRALARRLRASRLAEPARARRPSPGRNDPCPCGSGRKFKRCCGAARGAPAASAGGT